MKKRVNVGTLATGTVAVLLAAGWSVREAQFASAQAKRVASSTVNAAEVQMGDHVDQGKTAGKAGVYVDGSTAGLRKMQVGRFLLNPGATPHAPHRHADEEVLIVSRGTGEIECDGKTTAVKPGAVMFTDPNVEHGIKNTGTQPLEFYWVKYVPEGK
ncbi:MAG: cupin domain-containing protein [Armatimonadota bacterium]